MIFTITQVCTTSEVILVVDLIELILWVRKVPVKEESFLKRPSQGLTPSVKIDETEFTHLSHPDESRQVKAVEVRSIIMHLLKPLRRGFNYIM